MTLGTNALIEFGNNLIKKCTALQAFFIIMFALVLTAAVYSAIKYFDYKVELAEKEIELQKVTLEMNKYASELRSKEIANEFNQ